MREMATERRGVSRPRWLVEFRRRTEIIDIIDETFNIDCNCIVCQRLRKAAEGLGELFMPPRPTRPTEVR